MTLGMVPSVNKELTYRSVKVGSSQPIKGCGEGGLPAEPLKTLISNTGFTPQRETLAAALTSGKEARRKTADGVDDPLCSHETTHFWWWRCVKNADREETDGGDVWGDTYASTVGKPSEDR